DVSGEKTHHAAQTITGLAHDLLATHVNGEGIYSMRFHYWHGGLEMMRKGLWIDQVLGSGALTPDEQARGKAAAVLFANVLWDDDVVPLFEGHGLTLGTANMPVQQQGYRDFCSRLMGAWQASGKPQSGFFGTTLLTIDDTLPAGDPQLGDATFLGYYSVLRHGWGTPDETAVWIVNGDFYTDHRHEDHGSVVIYAL